jgi:glycosyltransferase involved in cell wall biosynthesis
MGKRHPAALPSVGTSQYREEPSLEVLVHLIDRFVHGPGEVLVHFGSRDAEWLWYRTLPIEKNDVAERVAGIVALTRISDEVVKIGLILDLSGPYSENTGQGSAAAAKMAVADFGGKVLGAPIELLVADHHNGTDRAGAIARDWFDSQQVDAILDVSGSSEALLVQRIADDFHQSIAAYKQFDVLLVNAVMDGLNLVAKEAPYVNVRDGVVVLSVNAGAYEEIGTWTVPVDPLDVEGQADALEAALALPEDERRARLDAIRKQVRSHDLSRWIDAQLSDLDRASTMRQP